MTFVLFPEKLPKGAISKSPAKKAVRDWINNTAERLDPKGILGGLTGFLAPLILALFGSSPSAEEGLDDSICRARRGKLCPYLVSSGRILKGEREMTGMRESSCSS